MQHGLRFSVNPARFTLTLRVYPLGTLGDHRRGSTVVRSRLTECWLGREVKTLTFVVTLFNNQNRQPDSRDIKHPDLTAWLPTLQGGREQSVNNQQGEADERD